MTHPKTTSSRILLVDDEQDIREVLGIALTDMGYEVLTADNGRAALEIFTRKRPPVVLTDIKMPVMDGIELLRRIKQADPETEVVMITGHGDMDLAVKSLKYEASDFITKPINVDALEIALKRVQERILMRTRLREYTEHLEALVREKTQLQDHLASLGLMIGSISHSIKGLLTGLDGGMYLLDTGIEKDDRERIEQGRRTVKLAVERIRKMVLDILFYAKDRQLERRPVKLADFCREVADGMRVHFDTLGIDFRMQCREGADTFDADADLLRSGLINILENAADACMKQKNPRKKAVVFGCTADEQQVRFTVEDNGIGMDLETREKIFTLFFSSKGSRGTGLGLFIANHVVRQHGGRIEVSSTPGRGSLFTITIPRQAPASELDGGS